jgi:hypothetical protein
MVKATKPVPNTFRIHFMVKATKPVPNTFRIHFMVRAIIPVQNFLHIQWMVKATKANKALQNFLLLAKSTGHQVCSDLTY